VFFSGTASCQFNAKSGVIDQLTFGDRPVDRDRLVGHTWCTALIQEVPEPKYKK